jgi:hypothetical protein
VLVNRDCCWAELAMGHCNRYKRVSKLLCKGGVNANPRHPREIVAELAVIYIC